MSADGWSSWGGVIGVTLAPLLAPLFYLKVGRLPVWAYVHGGIALLGVWTCCFERWEDAPAVGSTLILVAAVLSVLRAAGVGKPAPEPDPPEPPPLRLVAPEPHERSRP